MEITAHINHEKIIELLESHLINFENDGGLKKVYQQLINYSQGILNKNKISFTSIDNLNSNYKEIISNPNIIELATTIASDLPIFIKSDKENAKTIMVCAMDPLPPEPNKKNIKNKIFTDWEKRGFNLNNDIGFWAPFSLIDQGMGPNNVFFKELKSEYNLYVTDIYKIFFYIDKGNNHFAKSNSIKEYKNLTIHGKILTGEIEIIKPHFIITLGNDARNALLKINNEIAGSEKQKADKWDENNEIQKYKFNETTILSSPHISGSANGAKKHILKNSIYKNITDVNNLIEVQKLARIILYTASFKI